MSLPFDALFRHSPNAYMVVDREFRYLEVNHAYELLTGKRRQELLGRRVFDVFPGGTNPDGTSHADRVRDSIARAFARSERDVLALIPYAIETVTAEGPAVDTRYWSATHTPLRDAEGRVYAVMQHTTDVTELHRLREEVRRAREATGLTPEQLDGGVLSRAAAVQQDNLRLSQQLSFLVGLFEQAPGFMAVVRGPEHVFELANAAYMRLVGGRPVLGRSVREALPELRNQGFFELLDQVRETGNPFVGRGVPVMLREPDGSERTIFVDFVYQPIVGPDGRAQGIFVQGADVTDRETALTALRESESRFRTIANLLPQMIWSTTPDGRPDYFNQRWYDFTGVPEGATHGDAWAEVLHPDDREHARRVWAQSLADEAPFEVEYRLRDRHGQYRWVLGRAVPVRDADGRIVRWMGSSTDIHEHKRALELLEQSREALRAADRQKDQFLATLAHELRNPLAPIANAAQLLAMAPERLDNVRMAAEVITRQTNHMRHLVEDLMDVSRVTRGLVRLRRQRARLGDLVAAAIEQTGALVDSRGHRLELVTDAPELELQADPTRITQIVSNLLNNAAKYTPPGGTIVVEVTRERGEAVVRVRDTGIGMEPALLARVFDLFVQAETAPERGMGGLGIGLALARSLAQLHGGTLTAASPGLGQGSTFELRLPLAEAAVAPG